jgi:hypothetical protein
MKAKSQLYMKIVKAIVINEQVTDVMRSIAII